METRCEAILTTLPEEVLLRIVQHVANGGNADLRSMRAAHSKLRAGADTCAVRVAISLFSLNRADRCGLPGARLAALMQRFPNASRLCFHQGHRLSRSHLEGTMRLLRLMCTWGVAPGPDGAPACWRGVKHVYGCPSTCVPALAALCPGLEALSISLQDSNGVLFHDAAAALASLTGLTSLRIAFNRTEDPACGKGAHLSFWRRESVAALRALTRLRSLVVFTGGASLGFHSWADWVKGLTALTELQLVGLLPAVTAQPTGLRRLVLEGVGAIGLSSQLTGIAAAGLAQLTQLRCTSWFDRAGQPLPFGPALAAVAGLVDLSLPAARLAQGHLEALASAAPQLTRLEAASITASDECTAEFPKLCTLAAAFGPGYNYNLGLLAPQLQRLELAPSKVDEEDIITSAAGTLQELAMRGAFKDFCRNGRDSFSWVGCVDATTFEISDQLDLAAPIDKKTMVRDVLLELLSNLGGLGFMAQLSLTVAHQPDAALSLVAAAGTFSGLQRLRLRYVASLVPLDRVVGLLLYFRGLEELELEEGPTSSMCDESFDDSCLDLLEAGRPKSLTKVTLTDTWCVTRECVDAVQRRAAARGWPLEVVLDCSDAELLGARGSPR